MKSLVCLLIGGALALVFASNELPAQTATGAEAQGERLSLLL
jgi:hypothetical protein